MTLVAGSRLGPYEILSSIGRGGMGEVYKARDTRLDRAVAVKVLPSELATDPDRRQRFEREARAIAALEHPDICPLYDVGHHDGIHYLVMQHLDGETLAARLARGPLPLDQVLQVGVAIARALDRTHRSGITHRDLKPANVMLTRSGPKLLDFGLAKLRTAQPVSMSAMAGDGTAGPTTAQGTIAGTLQYMAPEQLEGREADARCDIWALGVVLYEMATGTRPFAGDTPASVIGAILKDAPPPISTRQPAAPRALDDAVARCLAKDADERWQSIGDVGRVLELIGSNFIAAASRHAQTSGASKERYAWIATTAALAIALAAAAWWRPASQPPGSAIRLSVNPPDRLTFTPHPGATVPIPQFAVAPDGRSIAFIAGSSTSRPSLWLRQLADLEARPLPGTEDAQEPFWSPDSQWIGFNDGQGILKRVAVSGGTVQTLARNITDYRGASWGPDGTLLIGTGYGGLFRIPASGGAQEPATTVDSARQEGSHRWPQFLPDGRRYLFTVRSGLADQRGIYLAAEGSENKSLLIRSDGDAQWAAPDHLLFLDADTLLIQRLDADNRRLVGEPIPVAGGIGRSSRGNGAFSISGAGILAYAGTNLRPGRLTWFDRRGTALGVVGPEGEHDYSDFRLSPDEARLAASLVDPKTSLPDIWLIDLVRGGQSRFTFGPAVNASAIWSPDGARIIFRTNRKGVTELYERAASAGGNEEPFLLEDRARWAGAGVATITANDWSQDGKYVSVASGAPSDLWLTSVSGDRTPTSLVRSPGDQAHVNFSPDSRFIAYSSNESGRFEVYGETFPRSNRKWTISTSGGYEPRWRADGKELYYLSDDRRLMAVPVATGGAAPFGMPQPLFQTDVHPGVSMLRTHYVPSRDGSRFLVHTRSRDIAPATITVVLNWMSLANR